MNLMKTKYFKQVCSTILLFFITGLFLFFAAFVLNKKDSHFKTRPFFTEKQNFDVLFLGTSHGVNAFFPMELWNDYGIISYNLSYHNAMLPMQYWVLKNALHYKKPKLVVIDLFWLSQGTKSDPNRFGSVHTVFDEFPLTMDKLRAVDDILNDSVPASKDSKAKFGLLFPFSLYHNRWEIGRASCRERV